MKNIIKILSFMGLFFAFSYCANDSGELSKAKAIQSNITLKRNLGAYEAQISMRYDSFPAGNFTIDEVVAADTKLDGLPLKSQQLIGCAGVVIATEVALKEKTIPFNKDAAELMVKTSWSTDSKQDLVQSFTLPPPFEIDSIPTQLSKTIPLHIKLKNGISKKDYLTCELELSNSTHSYWLFPAGQDDFTIKNIEISLDEIKKHFDNLNLPKTLNIKLTCSSYLKPSKNEGEKSELKYSLSSQVFAVQVLE